MNDGTEHTLALLRDIKDMLMGLAIMLSSLLVPVLFGVLLGALAFWIGIILAVAGLGVVWQGWHNHKAEKKTRLNGGPHAL